MKKRLLAVLSAVVICLFAIPVAAHAEEITIPDHAETLDLPDWIPNSFDKAMKFNNVYGETHIEDNLVCVVFKESTVNGWTYYCESDQFSELTVIIPVPEVFHETYSDSAAQIQYEVVVYSPPAGIDFGVYLGHYSDNVPYNDARYSFSVDENGTITETDFYGQSESHKGDVNSDGSFNVSDVVLIQKWLLSVPDTHLANWKAADFDEDGKLDVFDLCLMKRELIGQGQKEQNELYLATVTTRYSGHAVDGRDLGSGEFTEKFAVSKGDEFYETDNGYWIQDKTDFEPTVLKINDIDQNSVSLTFFHEGEMTETVIPFGGNLNVDSNFVICDGINYTYNISFSENDDVASKYYITPIGYSDNLLELAHSDNSSAVITSTEELKSYLTPITVYENTAGLLERYNDSFFEDNILLLNALYLSNTAEIYSIDSVVYKGDRLVVNYKLTIDGLGGCVVNGALGVAEIPKRNYHADNVEWKLTSYLMGLKMDYIAVFNSEESNNIIHCTYIYKIDNGAGNYGFDYINTSINTKNWNERIWGQGSVMWTDDVFPIAKANKAYDYVTIPGDETKYTIDEFMARFLMD